MTDEDAIAIGNADPDEVPEILEKLEPEERARALRTWARTQFSGPVPPSWEMEAYARVDPSFPDRLLTLSETLARQNHEQQMERAAVAREALSIQAAQIRGINETNREVLINERFGIVAGTFMFLVVFGLATVLILNGHGAVGVASLITALGAAVASVVWKRRTDALNNERVAEELEEAQAEVDALRREAGLEGAGDIPS